MYIYMYKVQDQFHPWCPRHAFPGLPTGPWCWRGSCSAACWRPARLSSRKTRMKTCSGDLPGQRQSCLHPGLAALASPSINSVVKRSKERGKSIWRSILTSLWMKGILLLTKCFHWCGSISPPQRRISTQLLIKNPSDSLRLGLHYASADNVVTADTFYNYCEFQCMPPLW